MAPGGRGLCNKQWGGKSQGLGQGVGKKEGAGWDSLRALGPSRDFELLRYSVFHTISARQPKSTSSMSHVNSSDPQHDVMKALRLCGLPLETLTTGYSWGNQQTNPSWGTFYKLAGQSSSKLSRSPKPSTSPRNCPAGRKPRRQDNQV